MIITNVVDNTNCLIVNVKLMKSEELGPARSCGTMVSRRIEVRITRDVISQEFKNLISSLHPMRVNPKFSKKF